MELINDEFMMAPYLASSLVNLFEPENKSEFKLTKDANAIRINDFSTNTSKPVNLLSNKLTFRDSNKPQKVDSDLSKTRTNYKFNVDHSNPWDRKLVYEFGKEMKISIKLKGQTSNKYISQKKLPTSPAVMASRFSTIFLPENPNKICDIYLMK